PRFEVGNPAYVTALFDAAGVADGARASLADAIDRKDQSAVAALVAGHRLRGAAADAILAVPDLYGGPEGLGEALARATTAAGPRPLHGGHLTRPLARRRRARPGGGGPRWLAADPRRGLRPRPRAGARGRRVGTRAGGPCGGARRRRYGRRAPRGRRPARRLPRRPRRPGPARRRRAGGARDRRRPRRGQGRGRHAGRRLHAGAAWGGRQPGGAARGVEGR